MILVLNLVFSVDVANKIARYIFIIQKNCPKERFGWWPNGKHQTSDLGIAGIVDWIRDEFFAIQFYS